MSPDEIIAVVQAYKEGKTIQARPKFSAGSWTDVIAPQWNFPEHKYRVKTEPKEIWVNFYEHDTLKQQVAYSTKKDAMRCKGRIKGAKTLHFRQVVDE